MRAGNAECREQNAECKVQNAKFKVFFTLRSALCAPFFTTKVTKNHEDFVFRAEAAEGAEILFGLGFSVFFAPSA